MRKLPIGSIAAFMLAGAANAGVVAGNVVSSTEPPECGQMYAPPYGASADARPRPCVKPQTRVYRPKYAGVGYEALDLESEACFVPDSAYQLLDRIIDEVRSRVAAEGLNTQSTDRRRMMERISALTGDVLADFGFGLYIPTETLGDALMQRQASGDPRYLVDCDTSSLILLTVAKSYGLPAFLVDITLPSGSGHNYVRWELSRDNFFDWDTNGRAECTTPAGLPLYEGRSMTPNQTRAYLLFVRALSWKKRERYDQAVADYKQATALDPAQPDPWNNVAWMIATREFPGRHNEKRFALTAATRAVAIRPSANQLDTLACAHALNKDFSQARTVQGRAIAADPDNAEFRDRLTMFQGPSPRDCTGLT